MQTLVCNFNRIHLRAGFSGAQLANLVNEAALMAGRTDVTEVSLVLLEDARDKILMGAQRKSLVQSLADRRMTAYHESGHAIVALNNNGAPPSWLTLV